MAAPPTLNASGSETLLSSVLRHVREGIRDGQMLPGQLLPSERELATQLQVSRHTVAAAYAQLEQQGVVRRVRGKGAFLCALPENGQSFAWSGKVSRMANLLDEPVLELLARRCAGDIRYPLSAGTPSLDIFPRVAYEDAARRLLVGELGTALAVAAVEGQWALRAAIGEWTGTRPQHILITSGAQEGIDLLARCLVEPEDAVVIDAPAYPGAIQSLRSAGARLIAWPTEWSLAHLEQLLLRFRPKLIFTTPTHQNPTGRVMSLKTRQGLLELAHRYATPVVEDDVYSRTGFHGGTGPENLYRLDEHGAVISISTFSKMLAPGLRLGWLAAPLYMIKQLSLIKMRSNLFTGGWNQLVLADLLRRGDIDRHLARLHEHHAMLCDAAQQALQPAVEAGLLRFRVPAGSLYLWCRLLTRVEPEAFFAALEAEGVSVAPGVAFVPEGERTPTAWFRICFTAVPEAGLRAGCAVLVRLLQQMALASRIGGTETQSAEALLEQSA